MKRRFFMLIGLLVTPAMAEVAPVFYDDELPIEYSDMDEVTDEQFDTEPIVTPTVVAPIKVSRQPYTTSSRSVSSQAVSSRVAPVSRGTAASGRTSSAADGRVVAARTGTSTSPRTVSEPSRSGVTSRSATSNRTSPGTATRAATTSQTSEIRTIGYVDTTTTPLYNANGAASSTPLYNANSTRISVRGTGVSARVPTIRVASAANSLSGSDMSTSTATSLQDMDSLAEMTDYCKAQYAACMDNYCNVLDDNQGRCSCSANLKNYAKAESALKSATNELQEVAQKIQYIGLNTREIETLFSETEAEIAMSGKTDTSQIKTSLDKIKDMLIEVRTGNATSDNSLSNFGFDLNGLLDFTIDSTGFDISAFLGTFGTGTNSVTNQRGEELYKTAQNRCKSAVLRSCTAQGVDANLITNSYDLQIDKECILYERSLTDANDQMVATVRNAKSVLQKARLLVSQQKNVYDMRGCINALDACMQDEFVCGTDYENCLDPTGRYIVNGAIVIGSQPGHVIDPNGTPSAVMTSDVCKINLYRTWDIGTCQSNKGNAWGSDTNDTLANYISTYVTQTAAQSSSTNMAEFLQNKIGYVSDTRNFGMCVSVLNKCQDYTYKTTGSKTVYDPTNDVIKQYLERVLIQIKAKQDSILADYADSCISDVSTCLSQNGYPADEPSTWTNGGSQQIQANIAINACRPTIVTCMSVNGYSTSTPTPGEMNCWVMGLLFNTQTSQCMNNYSGSGTNSSQSQLVGHDDNSI